ncbi:MAG: histidine phosphatase family protein [Acidimicrobiales bacterium]
MLHVLRHGRTEANKSGLLLGRADPDLDDTGRQQAAAAAAALPVGTRVISSPLARTRQTASFLDPDHEVDDRLLELDYGEFDLAPVASIPPETWAQWRSDPEFAPPGGESLRALHARVGELLGELAESLADSAATDVVLVTHVSPIKAALGWALGTDTGVMWRSFVDQASITRIGVSDRGPSLRVFNDTAHLRDLDVT